MWEKIPDYEDRVNTSRMKVPGGWIVRTVAWLSGVNTRAISVHNIFVPDVDHAWTIPKT